MPLGEAILLLFLVLIGVGGASYKVIQWDKKRVAQKRQLQGEENARRLMAASENCFRCHVPINPNLDVYHKGTMKKGAWWCRRCFQEILR